MRTTLNIDDVLEAARELARRGHRSAGEIVSELARRGLTAGKGGNEVVSEDEPFYGFRPLPRRADVIVTNELVDKLREDGAYTQHLRIL